MNTDINKKAKTSAKDFFLWFGAMAALYFSVGSLVALLFHLISKVFTMSIVGYDPYSGGLSFAIASLLIILPVYLYLTRVNNQRVRDNPINKEMWVRKWGLYFTLFISGVGMLIDLITLLYTFLQGEEMTPEFLLKVLVIFVIFGSVFWYYLKDINGYWQSKERLSKSIGGIVALVVLASIVSGFFIMGSPATQRMLKQDRERISNLQNIQYDVLNYYRDKQELPESLEALNDPLEGRGYVPVDPDTGEAYEYRVIDVEDGKDAKFELCANFSKESIKIEETRLKGGYDDWRVRELMQEGKQWGHGAERTCYERTVDAEKYEKYLPLSPKAIRID